MTEQVFMERLENVLEAMGLRTFEAPQTLNYRFGSIPAEDGYFRCFVHENDIKLAPNFIEMIGNQVYWIALEYPGADQLLDNIRRINLTCSKALGRIHSETYILALEEPLATEEVERFKGAVESFHQSILSGTYITLWIWDEEELTKHETYLQTLIDKER